MKAELKTLKDLLTQISSASETIFIIGHNEPDFDSIGSSLALQSLCTSLGKNAYIVIKEPDCLLEPGVKKIKERNQKAYNIIDLDTYHKIKVDSSSLIVVDTNNINLTCTDVGLDNHETIIIIDHHQPSQTPIPNAKAYIREKASSVSEIITLLLNESKTKHNSDIYTYLLSGIILDTKRFKKNTTSKTHECAKSLINKGATIDNINELFLEDFDSDKRINDLVFNGTKFYSYQESYLKNRNFSFTLNRINPTMVYRKEDIAKAADKMLKYSIDAAFALGYVNDNEISVSARSKSDIDVGEIMTKIGGGGNHENAGARLKDINIEELEEIIKNNLFPIDTSKEADEATTPKKIFEKV